jgi:hypothetical protein
MMTDETFPQVEPDDADEVVLALKTGGSLWASGEKTEAIRWLRKAQEAADEAGNDMRSLALARAAADLTEAAKQAEAPPGSESKSNGTRPQLTKPPKPPPNPKTRLETPSAKSSAERNATEASDPSPQVEPDGPMLSQALRVCVKRSVRDDELLVARLLEDGEVPVGYHEALVVLTDPTEDLLDKLS